MLEPRLDRIGSADLGEMREHRHGLIALGRQLAHAERADALGERLAIGADQQREMAERGNLSAQRLENLDLHAGIGDVIFAAHDVGDLEIHIVHHRRQRVEKRAVLADQHRVGERGGVDRLRPAHEIDPILACARELETPMRLAALGFQFGAVCRA